MRNKCMILAAVAALFFVTEAGAQDFLPPDMKVSLAPIDKKLPMLEYCGDYFAIVTDLPNKRVATKTKFPQQHVAMETKSPQTQVAFKPDYFSKWSILLQERDRIDVIPDETAIVPTVEHKGYLIVHMTPEAAKAAQPCVSPPLR